MKKQQRRRSRGRKRVAKSQQRATDRIRSAKVKSPPEAGAASERAEAMGAELKAAPASDLDALWALGAG